MNTLLFRKLLYVLAMATALGNCLGSAALAADIVYLTPGLQFPYWQALAKGVEAQASKSGFGFQALDSNHSPQIQLANARQAIARGVAGIVLSPTDSSTAPEVLALAKQAKIPVVVADVGTNSGDYISFIISDNRNGAYQTGKALVEAMKQKGWRDNTVALVTLSLARNNGKLRTEGFQHALQEGAIRQSGQKAMQTYTADETRIYTEALLKADPALRGLFIETDTPTLGAVQAIRAAGRTGTLAVAAFDGTPEFVELIRKGDIVVSGMQQPYLIGERAGEALFKHLKGEKVPREVNVPVLVVTRQNLDALLPTLRRTVFGEAPALSAR